MKNQILVCALVLVIASCTKQARQPLAPEDEVVQPKLPRDVVLENKERDAYFKKIPKGWNNPNNPHYQPPDDTTQPPPPPPPTDIKSVLFIDMDGQTISNNNWNVGLPIVCNNSGLSLDQQTTLFNEVKEDFSIFSDVIVTTDSNVFYSTQRGKRMRCIVTTSYEWFGYVGGVAYINSYSWLDDTPCFVFTPGLSYNGIYSGRAVSHELGHTLGLRHQSEWLNGTLVTEYYDGGSSPDAPIMGLPYYKQIARWWEGYNSVFQWQVDIDIINANK